MITTLMMTIMLTNPTPSSVIPQPRDGWHADRHMQINAKVAATKDDVDVVFIGDSITQSWEDVGRDVWQAHFADLTAINLGISGDRTEHVLWRLDHGNLDGIKPKIAVVMIGTNNIGHGTHTTSEVLAGVQRVVARIREISPSTEVLLLDIFPRGFEFNQSRGRILQINQALSRLNVEEGIRYMPIGHVFLEDDGSICPDIMPDGLHLSPAGYRRWAEAISPTIDAMLSTDQMGEEHS